MYVWGHENPNEESLRVSVCLCLFIRACLHLHAFVGSARRVISAYLYTRIRPYVCDPVCLCLCVSVCVCTCTHSWERLPIWHRNSPRNTIIYIYIYTKSGIEILHVIYTIICIYMYTKYWQSCGRSKHDSIAK